MKKTTLIIVILFYFQSFSQIKKFGKVSIDELKSTENTQFKNANAVVLFKYRETHYDYNGEKGWQLITTVHERIKLYNKESFNWATKKIKYYTGNSEKEGVSIKATTYNLVNNKIVKTKVKNKEIYNKKEDKFWSSKKFTMPNISEGCIVEWKYTITSPYVENINDIVFQYEIPILYMEASVKIPEYFVFNTDVSKYYLIDVKTQKTNTKKINYSYQKMVQQTGGARSVKFSGELDFYENEFIIREHNINALKQEPYVNNMNNYRGLVKFELSSIKYPNSMYKNYTTNWDDVTKTISELSSFGGELKKTKYFEQDLETILNGITEPKKKMNAILKFVKNKIAWNGYSDYYVHDGVKKAYKNGSGNVAEVNLILVAMLRKAGFDASPILISTRSHGVPIFPTRNGFNYVIAGVEMLDKILLFDATEKYSSVNILPKRDLNWKGRIIRKTGTSAFINLFPEIYSTERDILSVKLHENGNIEGTLRASFGSLKALESRVSFSDLSEDKLISKLEDNLTPIEIEKIRLRNKKDVTKPFLISFKYSAEDQLETISNKIYFTPIFMLNNLENKFKSDTRKLPIDFASAWMEINEISIYLPEGYKIETLPDNISLATKNNIASFDYDISSDNNKINLKVITKINLPIIPVNLYKELKDFYTEKIIKLKEKVVLIKK